MLRTWGRAAPGRRVEPRVGLGLVVALAVTVALAATAGAAPQTRAAASSPTLTVVAAENFWGSIVKQLAGSKATVSSIITNPSTDPHSYEAKPSDERSIAGAKYVVVNGIGYDPWAQQALDANPSSGRKVLVVGQLLGLQDGDNPHQWYSPDNVQRVVDRVTADLQAIDAKDAAYFAARRAAFDTVALGQYHALVSQIRATYAGAPVGASESIFAPLADGLGLRLITPPTFLEGDRGGHRPDRGGQGDRRSAAEGSPGQGLRVQLAELDSRRAGDREGSPCREHPGDDRDRDARPGERDVPGLAGEAAQRAARRAGPSSRAVIVSAGRGSRNR